MNSRVERIVILNDITQYKNKVLGDESNKLPSSIGWIGAWRKSCLHFSVWLRRSNRIVDLIKMTAGIK